MSAVIAERRAMRIRAVRSWLLQQESLRDAYPHPRDGAWRTLDRVCRELAAILREGDE